MGHFFRVLVPEIGARGRDPVRIRRTGGIGRHGVPQARALVPRRGARSRSGHTRSSLDRIGMRRGEAAKRLPGRVVSLRPAGGSAFQSLQAARHRLQQIVVVAAVGGWPRSHDQVSLCTRGEPVQAYDLSQAPFQSIPLHRRVSVSGNDDRGSRCIAGTGAQKQIDRPASMTAARSKYATDLAGSPKPAGARKRECSGHVPGLPPVPQRRCLRFTSSLTVREWRPRLRRRASTFRPAFVFMRARNP